MVIDSNLAGPQPPIEVLVRAVKDFLLEIALPELQGVAAFQARMAARQLEIVERTLLLSADNEHRELAGLQELLHSEEELGRLRKKLAAMIRSGAMSIDTPGLLEHLKSTTIAALAIDNPAWLDRSNG